MPIPSQTHVDAGLANLAIQMANEDTFIADKVFPVVPVDKQSDKIFHIDPQSEIFRNHDDTRTPGTDAKTVDFQIDSSLSYFANDHAIDLPVTDEERANADQGAGASLDRAGIGLGIIKRNREVNLVSVLGTFLNAASLTSSPGTKWDSDLSGDPVTDINAKITALEASSGVSPNTLSMDIAVARHICNHPSVLSRPGIIGMINTQAPELRATVEGYAAVLKFIFGVDYVNIAKIVNYNSAVKGATTPTFTRIWSDSVLLSYTGPINLMTSCIGAHFVWSSGVFGPAGPQGFLVRQFRDDRKRSNIVGAEMYYDQKVLRVSTYAATTCGWWFTNVLNAI